MDYKAVEIKWQKKWDESKLYKFNKSRISKKYYVLEMLPYPSGAKLHVGHWYNYGPSDSFARFKRMKGYEVFQPMGFDAFGLPAENYAIKTGIHPQQSTMINIESMEKTLKQMGASFDWDYEVKTCMPDYYKWTQWLFLQFYKKGLAYRKNAPVNWCPSCNTVLANEQVIDNHCERCKSEVVRKDLTQWFFKITDYAEELLQDLDKLDWPEKTKAMQKNWIGKSSGALIKFECEDQVHSFEAFTTRADTLFGVSYVVLAPEHPLVDVLTTEDKKQDVENYKLYVSKSNEIERLSTNREKTGTFIGAYAINPINKKRVPIFISDYVLYSYGTGAVMGVPAHDERDYQFAQKYNMPITQVVSNPNGPTILPYCEYGISVNSMEFSGLTSEEAKKSIVEKLHIINKGSEKINYRLRDWLISRQRYWGCPIPIIHCPDCGEVMVDESALPVLLPEDVDFTPDGKSPLLKSRSFMNVKCPKCGKDAKRDPDTLDTFVCSSWYFLRYPDAKNTDKAFDSDLINKMLPVDKYIGGAEHACMHLLYARFFTKALRDMGLLNFDEPFTSLIHQGTILGPDGFKMSKSLGNTVSPDDYVDKLGSDPFRMYLMFGFSYTEGGPWNATGIDSIIRFLDKISKYTEMAITRKSDFSEITSNEKELNYVRHNSIKNINNDLENFSFNTAIARLMEFSNAMSTYANLEDSQFNSSFFKECVYDMILLLAPFAPHTAEELNEMMGNKYSVFNCNYPEYDEKALIKDEYELAVQINSKIKTKIIVSADMTEDEIKEIALADSKIAELIDGHTIVKCLVIPKRLVNIVIK